MDDTNTNNDLDIGAIGTSFASELTGSPESSQPQPSESAAQLPAAPPPPPAPGKPLPKAWKKEMEAHWSKLDPALHDYVYQREADVSRGIQTYKDGHEAWTSILQPHAQLLQQYPDVNPRQLLANLLQSHVSLSTGDAAQKQAIARQLLTAYGIDLSAQPQAPDPVAAAIAPLQSRLENFERQQQLAETQRQLGLVQQFFADPKNEYAPDLADDILALVQRGFPLEKAYQHALWTNEPVRAKMLAKQSAAPGAAALNVGAGAANSPPAPRKGTMDDTVDAVIKKHYPTVTH